MTQKNKFRISFDGTAILLGSQKKKIRLSFFFSINPLSEVSHKNTMGKKYIFVNSVQSMKMYNKV